MTSAIYGHGKGTLFNSLATNCRLSCFVSDLQNQEATQEQVGKAGLQLFLTLYGGKPCGHAAYFHLVSKSLGKLQPEKLPPTDRAAYYHSLRVHLQAVVWKLLSTSCLVPTDWGWMREGQRLIPISTNLHVAPDSIMNIVHCGCRMRCSSALCTCRRNGVNCMTACHCHGRLPSVL